MDKNNSKDFGRGLILVWLAAVVSMVGWYKLYIEPNDAIVMEIVSCMGDDDSRKSYEECRRKTIAARPNFQSRY